MLCGCWARGREKEEVEGGEGNGVEWDKLISHSEVINRLRHVGSV